MKNRRQKMKAVILATMTIVVLLALITAGCYFSSWFRSEIEKCYEWYLQPYFTAVPLLEITIEVLIDFAVATVCLAWVFYDYHWKAIFRINTLMAFFVIFIVVLLVLTILFSFAPYQIVVVGNEWAVRIFKIPSLLFGATTFQCLSGFWLSVLFVYCGYKRENEKILSAPKKRAMDVEELEQRVILEVLTNARKKGTPSRIRFFMRTDESINGFAHGKLVVINMGALNVDKEILHSIVAHEISHVRNHDSLVNHIISVPSKIYLKPMQLLTRYIYLSVGLLPLIGRPIARILGWVPLFADVCLLQSILDTGRSKSRAAGRQLRSRSWLWKRCADDNEVLYRACYKQEDRGYQKKVV